MKKIALLFSFAISAIAANAQLTLGTSPYTQNFDGIGAGLPDGWTVYSGASVASIGTLVTYNTDPSYGIYYDTASCAGSVFGGGFKNYASAEPANNGGYYNTSCDDQQTRTNRALGVRQVSPTNMSNPNLDSGAAFVLELSNTTNKTNFNLTFKLQSLDIRSPRQTTWQIDYAIGTPTNFVAATNTTGYLITGGLKFSDTTVTVNFGTALDNKSQPVYIRLTTLLFSNSALGSGNRASTAIDDYSLTWTGGASGVNNVSAQTDMPLTVVGNATSEHVTLGYSASISGDYSLCLYDMTGRIIYKSNIASASGTQHYTIDGLNLAKGMYVAKMTGNTTLGVTKIMIQ